MWIPSTPEVFLSINQHKQLLNMHNSAVDTGGVSGVNTPPIILILLKVQIFQRKRSKISEKKSSRNGPHLNSRIANSYILNFIANR